MTKKLFYLIGAALLVLFVYLLFQYFNYTQYRDQVVADKGHETTAELRDQVDEILTKIVDEGNRLAELFGSKEYTAKEVEKIIRESALSIPEIQGVTACYENYAFSKNKELFCPYYNKSSQGYVYVEDSYDYTVVGEGTAWYTSVRDGGAKWVEPYYGEAAADWFVDYGIPFYFKDGSNKGKVRGTITMSFICSGFKKLVHNLSIGKTGYGIITSPKGKFLVHPINEYIGTANLDTIKKETKEKVLIGAYDAILNGETGNVSFFDPLKETETLFFYDKIPTSDWGMGLMFFKEDLLNDEQTINRHYIKLALVFSLLFVCLLGIYYGKDYLDEGEIWRLSIISSLLLLGNLLLVGYLQHTSLKSTEDKSPPIIDNSALGSFVNQQHTKAELLKTPKARPIPTGIYIKRMEFEDSYNLNVGGTLWQKYPVELLGQVETGFTFPQMSPFAEASYIEEAYRKEILNKEGEISDVLIGWEFRVTLQLNFEYSDYPFDKRHINIEIAPMSNNDHLIFTPDLESYKYTNPSQKSGLNPKIRISGSEVLDSYFNYSLDSYDTDFGFGNQEVFEEVPILHFNIHLRRILLNSFVTYLIPIFVTLIMVFILIQACTKTVERQGIIESMAAFFFVLIFSHIDLRKEIVTADLIYMEYFYFIAYFMLILSTFNLITYTKDKSDIFDFNENQIFKALYTPMFLLVLLIVTLYNFY